MHLGGGMVAGAERLSVTWQGRGCATSDSLTLRMEQIAAEPAKQHYMRCNVAGSFIYLEEAYLVAMAPLAEDGLGTPKIPSFAAERGR